MLSSSSAVGSVKSIELSRSSGLAAERFILGLLMLIFAAWKLRSVVAELSAGDNPIPAGKRLRRCEREKLGLKY